MGTFLLNEKRSNIHEIEKRQNVQLLVIPNTSFETPHYEVKRVRSDEVEEEISSHELSFRVEEIESKVQDQQKAPAEIPAVKTVGAVRRDIGFWVAEKRLKPFLAWLHAKPFAPL